MFVLVNINSNKLSHIFNQTPFQLNINDTTSDTKEYKNKIIYELSKLFSDHQELITEVFNEQCNITNINKNGKNITKCDVYTN
jgi:hypothetical protein